MKVVIVKDFYPPASDTRVNKILLMLKNIGYDTFTITWDWNKASKDRFSVEGTVLVGPRLPFGPRRALFFPIWWGFILKKLLKNDWDIAHVINLPSLLPVLIVGKLRRKKVVYDIEDVYIDQIEVPNFIRITMIGLERFLAQLCNRIILIDAFQHIELNLAPSPKIKTIYDSPHNHLVSVNQSEKRYEKSPNKPYFELFYAGGFSKSRRLNLEVIFEAVPSLNDVHLSIAGFGDDLVDLIKLQASISGSNIEFLGKLPYETVIRKSMEADLLFNIRDPVPPVNRYVCGAKLLEAMMCGKPILVSKGTSSAQKVLKEKCGMIVDPHNVFEIRNAIRTLKENKDLSEFLGKNSRKAYELHYSWALMERRLSEVYQSIFRKTC